MIIWVASYPRSGNTFLRILLNRFFEQKTYSKYNDEIDIGKDSSFSETVGHLKYEGDWAAFYKSSALADDNIFIKTHDKPEDDSKAIFIVRDGRSAAVSYWKYLRSHSKLEVDLSDVISGTVSFGTWSSHYRAWDPTKRPNTLLIRYESFVANPIKEIERIGEFIGKKPRAGQVPEFETLKEKYPNFFRVGNDRENMDEISDEETEWMMMQFGPSLKALGYVENDEYDESVVRKEVDKYQQKSLKVKREVAALSDNIITSRLEGRLQNLKLDIDNELGTIRDKLNGIGPDLAVKLDKYSEALNGSQQKKLLEELRVDLDDNIEKILASSEATSSQIVKFEERANKQTVKTTRELIKAIEAFVDKKFARIEKPLHKKLDVVSGLSSAMQSALKDSQNKQKAQLTKSQNAAQKAIQKNLIKTVKSEVAPLNEVLPSLDVGLKNVQMHQTEVTQQTREVLDITQALFENIVEVAKAVDILKETRTDREDLIGITHSYIKELEQKNQFLVKHVVESVNSSESQSRLIERLRKGIRRLSKEHDNLLAQNAEYEYVLQPRFRSILELRPAKFILKNRKIVKSLGGSADSLNGLPSEKILKDEGIGNIDQENAQPPIFTKIDELIPEYSSIGNEGAEVPINPSVSMESYATSSPSHQHKAPLGIAVYTFDRKDMVHNVLESLAQQGVLDSVHVFIDGDQGNPKKRRIVDQTEERVRQYPVKKIHRNRGNFGFRKMMLTSQRYMLERYEKIIFLEDDCFPTNNAVSEFSRELDLISDDPSIFSVYGHPFLVPGEDKPFGRFQGWGWATTSSKLEPFWRRLMDIYLFTEAEYLSFIEENLTDDIVKKIDITPGRQPSSTLRNFFAWDETLCMLTAMHDVKHKRSDNRLIYNCGVGDSSAHFSKLDYYKKPPFNMVSPEHVWDYF